MLDLLLLPLPPPDPSHKRAPPCFQDPATNAEPTRAPHSAWPRSSLSQSACMHGGAERVRGARAPLQVDESAREVQIGQGQGTGVDRRGQGAVARTHAGSSRCWISASTWQLFVARRDPPVSRATCRSGCLPDHTHAPCPEFRCSVCFGEKPSRTQTFLWWEFAVPFTVLAVHRQERANPAGCDSCTAAAVADGARVRGSRNARGACLQRVPRRGHELFGVELGPAATRAQPQF